MRSHWVRHASLLVWAVVGFAIGFANPPRPSSAAAGADSAANQDCPTCQSRSGLKAIVTPEPVLPNTLTSTLFQLSSSFGATQQSARGFLSNERIQSGGWVQPTSDFANWSHQQQGYLQRQAVLGSPVWDTNSGDLPGGFRVPWTMPQSSFNPLFQTSYWSAETGPNYSSPQAPWNLTRMGDFLPGVPTVPPLLPIFQDGFPGMTSGLFGGS